MPFDHRNFGVCTECGWSGSHNPSCPSSPELNVYHKALEHADRETDRRIKLDISMREFYSILAAIQHYAVTCRDDEDGNPERVLDAWILNIATRNGVVQPLDASEMENLGERLSATTIDDMDF